MVLKLGDYCNCNKLDCKHKCMVKKAERDKIGAPRENQCETLKQTGCGGMSPRAGLRARVCAPSSIVLRTVPAFWGSPLVLGVGH